jgi:hypothetical protein
LEVAVDTPKDSAPARAPEDPNTRLQRLEEKYRRELLTEDERLEVLDKVLRLRRKLAI